MKVLYIKDINDGEYLGDMTFHGLRTLLGADVVDWPKLVHMYDNYPSPHLLYGKGFSVFATLPDIEVDRTDIEEKIRGKYFDAIIYGACYRVLDELGAVLHTYDKNQIIYLDGDDPPSMVEYLIGTGLYFKRELIHSDRNDIFPISFSFPREKMCRHEPSKDMPFATVIPGRCETYVFNDEDIYYYDYQRSFFGLTCPKAGWDCLRHYEILFNKCIPWFQGLEHCPVHTMDTFPKDILLSYMRKVKGVDPVARKIHKEWFEAFHYEDTLRELFEWAVEKMTTEAVAKSVLEKVNERVPA